MSLYSEGDWVRYRSNGYSVTKMVLAVRPDGCLVTGDHKHDSNNHTIDPDYRDVTKVQK